MFVNLNMNRMMNWLLSGGSVYCMLFVFGLYFEKKANEIADTLKISGI